jgi:hypothetical protein
MPTLSRVADKLGVCPMTVKSNVEQLLKVLTIEERVQVMEYMLESRKPRGRMKGMKLLLDDLPATKEPKTATEFLGVTKDDLWLASQTYERKMKKADNPYDAFKLKEELVSEIAEEITQRNLQWIIERINPNNPMAMLDSLGDAPTDKLNWVLKLLRRHGYLQVDLSTWIAADMFICKLVKQCGNTTVSNVIGKALGRGEIAGK